MHRLRHEIKHCRRSMWTSTILHEQGGVPMVVQSIMNRHKFIQNLKIFCSIYRLPSKNGPIIPLEEIAAQIITFGEYRDEGTATCEFLVPQMRQLCLLTKPSSLKYASSENHMLPTSISPSSKSCSIAFTKS
ncbi:hypothetical protein AVEN_214031-1 [Araneus ventricosus]|uniref:Uncharacterized protein n=1 Tax=Araneus ventricosus TaxID=182803 RepID=A0A4Y2L663_ARAVE|nr:hypothetical protein AVEN_214031-1 [Araneus ventricosus]